MYFSFRNVVLPTFNQVYVTFRILKSHSGYHSIEVSGLGSPYLAGRVKFWSPGQARDNSRGRLPPSPLIR